MTVVLSLGLFTGYGGMERDILKRTDSWKKSPSFTGTQIPSDPSIFSTLNLERKEELRPSVPDRNLQDECRCEGKLTR